MNSNSDYYSEFAAAFVRGSSGEDGLPEGVDPIEWGREQRLPLHHFKRKIPLARVEKILGVLKGLRPADLVDVGSQRGAFLWPLMDYFDDLEVMSVEPDALWARRLDAVRRGGVSRLTVLQEDFCTVCLPDEAADVVTILEVLEHLETPLEAARQAVRVARRFVLASVPSREDDNPGHVNLFTGESLMRLFQEAGARRVQIEYIHGHIIAVVNTMKGSP